MTDKFTVEQITKFTCVKCGLIIQVPTIPESAPALRGQRDEYCPPDQCPACATGDIHIVRTPLRHSTSTKGIPCW